MVVEISIPQREEYENKILRAIGELKEYLEKLNESDENYEFFGSIHEEVYKDLGITRRWYSIYNHIDDYYLIDRSKLLDNIVLKDGFELVEVSYLNEHKEDVFIKLLRSNKVTA